MADDIQTLLDQLKNTQVTAPDTTRPSNIGVPNDYRPPALSQVFGVQDIPGQRPYSQSVMGEAVGPVRYPTGSELRPLNTPEIVPQLQAQMIQAGLLDAKNVRPGVWDSSSQSAYKKVLALANQQGITAQQALAMLAANPTIGDLQGGSSRAPNIVQETNPVDIAATAQDTAQKLLGRRLSDAELQPFIERYQSLEKGAQDKAYKLGGANGGVVVTPPSVNNAAEDYYRKNFGPEVMGYAAVERMNEFYSLLNSPVSGA